MKKNFLKIAGIISICIANQAFSWHFNVTNLTDIPQDVEAKYPGCRNDRFTLGTDSTKSVDAYECILGGIMVHNRRQLPYSGPTRVHPEFYIIGPVEGEYLTGRFE